MKSYIALGCVLLTVACRTDEHTDDPIEALPSVEERLSSPITLRYLGEEGTTITATAFIFTSSRPLALRVSMPNTGDGALSSDALARLRTEMQIEVTVESGLDAWAVRGVGNKVDKLDGAAFYTYFETSEAFPTLCGDQIAKARLLLSDGAHTFKSRFTVMDPFRPFGLYNTTHCKENGWFEANSCTRVSADIPCSHVIDCGTALGGTRRCTGECKFIGGFWDDLCQCEVNEATCCAQTLPPQPVKTEQQTQFEN
jgi:hypothetical protein